MNIKSKISIFTAVATALITFACLGGAPATSTPAASTESPIIPTEQVLPKDGKLEITNTSSYVDGFNDYNVVGEIVNNTNDTVENLTLSISITDETGASLLKDENDNPVERLDIQPYITVLAPGTSTPFNYYISADEVQPAKFDVTIKSYDPSSAPELIKFDIQSVQTNFIGEDVTITGEVVNLTAQQMDVESLAGALLDRDGKVLAANSTLTYSRYLYPAGDPKGRDRGPFIIKIFGPIENVAQWKVYVRSVKNTLVPETDVDVRLAGSYVDTYGTYHLLGTVTNNGSSQISPAVIGGLYNPDKNVFDAASLNIPVYLNAGESAPFDLKSFQVMGSLPDDQTSAPEEIVQPDLYWTFHTSYQVVSLESQNIKLTQADGDWTVDGTVVNTSGESLGSINAVIFFLDSNQQVLATNSTTIYPAEGSDVIKAGETGTFNISIPAMADWDLGAQDYQIILQGVISE